MEDLYLSSRQAVEYLQSKNIPINMCLLNRWRQKGGGIHLRYVIRGAQYYYEIKALDEAIDRLNEYFKPRKGITKRQREWNRRR